MRQQLTEDELDQFLRSLESSLQHAIKLEKRGYNMLGAVENLKGAIIKAKEGELSGYTGASIDSLPSFIKYMTTKGRSRFD